MKKIIAAIFAFIIILSACKKEKTPAPINTTSGPNVIFKFKFDSTQTRLDNTGSPCTVPAGNAAQSPKFNQISAHYIELAPNAFTQVGNGEVLYHATETTLGGNTAIDFALSKKVQEGETFLSIPISSIAPGTYEWLRVSLSYQNYNIRYNYMGNDYTGVLASFVGFRTYISNYTIDQQSVTINANKDQGYWGFETFGQVYQGQSAGTTVPNPISSTSPIPAGSCLVTGQFANPFTITGNETQDIIITISLSTNKSFEWEDDDADGKFSPSAGDTVVDMGLRGLIPIVN